ncbi:hypothetical protein ACX80O_10275 [Arthrobacter sp. Hz1]
MAIDNVPPGSVASPTRPKSGRRRFALIPAVLLLIVGSLVYIALSQEKPPSVPLGASAAVTGGLSRVNGIIPLESDDWKPQGSPTWLGNPPGDSSHRVRVLLELTALEPNGVAFDADDYFVAGVGTDRHDVVWAPIESAFLAQGDNLTATLIFELPDQAILLTLENDDGVRLSLGTAHHSGGQ